jgi:hypothetical protein
VLSVIRDGNAPLLVYANKHATGLGIESLFYRAIDALSVQSTSDVNMTIDMVDGHVAANEMTLYVYHDDTPGSNESKSPSLDWYLVDASTGHALVCPPPPPPPSPSSPPLTPPATPPSPPLPPTAPNVSLPNVSLPNTPPPVAPAESPRAPPSPPPPAPPFAPLTQAVSQLVSNGIGIGSGAAAVGGIVALGALVSFFRPTTAIPALNTRAVPVGQPQYLVHPKDPSSGVVSAANVAPKITFTIGRVQGRMSGRRLGGPESERLLVRDI